MAAFAFGAAAIKRATRARVPYLLWQLSAHGSARDDGRTTGQRIRISRSEGASARCYASGGCERCRTFTNVHALVHNHFNQERALYGRQNFKLMRAGRFEGAAVLTI